ncbi:hypothetical protein [Rhizobium sp. BK251]|uniref:hypothetical protein n=1 Tax=Rhizobium sp. BK251 TaxID=2512125 RepID=UPI00104CE5B2|nr:hypothetical protein [Rhizobium sp. BK251]TCL62922.1 hypothetical protein EV286_11828 [Rhizobium sp. BK251]
MNTYLEALLTTTSGQRVMAAAEKYFSGADFSDLSAKDLGDWQNRVFSDVRKAYPDAVKDASNLVNAALNAWLKQPSNMPATGQLLQQFEGLADEIMQNPAPPKYMDDAKEFKAACFSAMATMALATENASKTIPRTDAIATVISRARAAVTCDEYVERFGDMPSTARIGKDEKPSDYWASMMKDVAPFSDKDNQKILSSLRTIEQSTKVDVIADALDQLVESMQAVTKANLEPGLSGRAEMVFAEAMRSDKVMPGGAYRSDQPNSRKSVPLTSSESAEMQQSIDQADAERKKKEISDPTGPGR